MTKQFLKIVETLDGGDLVLKGNDLEATDSLLNQPYPALFGGNVIQGTDEVDPNTQGRGDWWANEMLFRNEINSQNNSKFERALNTTPLNSEGVALLEEIALSDLSYLSDLADISVDIHVEAANRARIEIKIIELESLTSQIYVYLWDSTKLESSQLSEIAQGGTISGAAPDTPQNLVLTVQGTDQIDAVWDVVSGADSYTLEWDTVNTFDSPNFDSISIASPSHSITPLNGGIEYFVQVKSVNTVGESPYSSIESASTDVVPFTFTVNATDGTFTFPQRLGTSPDFVISSPTAGEEGNTVVVTSDTDPTLFTFNGGIGIYTLEIAGVDIWASFSSGDNVKLVDILNYGNVIVTALSFNGSSNLTAITAIDTPTVFSEIGAEQVGGFKGYFSHVHH